MKFMLLNTHSFSTKPNTWIMIIFASLTYFKLSQNKMEKLDMIIYILVQSNFGITFHYNPKHEFLHI
jgi:hypothetical protein